MCNDTLRTVHALPAGANPLNRNLPHKKKGQDRLVLPTYLLRLHRADLGVQLQQLLPGGDPQLAVNVFVVKL